MSGIRRRLFVAHADGADDRIRIISARETTRRETHDYQERSKKTTDELRPEYDLSKLTGGIRGKYYKRATAGTTLVLLEPDVAEAFPDGRTVNEVLRAVVKVARTQAGAIRSGLPGKPMQAKRGKPSARKKRFSRRG